MALTTHESYGGSVTRGYRPQLDGLRAVAVYLVVLFHAGIGRFTGGFIGVDIFFVLSGYLVTQLLLNDFHRSGSISFSKFYSRRFRRLLPAAFVTLLVTAAVFAAVATPAQVLDSIGGFRACFLYYANWFFIHQATDYWGPDVEASPVLQFWSLAVEEQFYLCWPLLLSGLYLVTRSARRYQWVLIRIAVLLGAAVSLFAALRIAESNLARAFYGTDTRAYQLLAGAALALTPNLFTFANRHRKVMQYASAASLAALVLLGTSVIDLAVMQRGLAVVVATCVFLVTIDCSTGGFVARGLSLPSVVYLGRVSYGTYLWHWPVIIVAARVFDLTPLATAAITFLLATGLASLSYQLLERPVRESGTLDRYRIPVVAAGLAISVCSALVFVPSILDRDDASATAVRSGTDSAAGAVPVPEDLDWQGARTDLPEYPDCYGKPVDACTMVQGDGAHILLMGDSHARMLVPALAAIAEQRSLSLSVAIRPACPWQEGLTYRIAVEGCREYQADWYGRVVPELDPDLVVVTNRPYDDPASDVPLFTSDGAASPGTDEYEGMVRELSAETIAGFRDDDRKVLIVEPIPIAPPAEDPTDCLSAATYLDECRYVANQGVTPTEASYRSAAEQDGVWSLDLDPLVCPFLPICDPVVEGIIVKRDKEHLTGTYARGLADEIQTYLGDNGVLEL
ncbi:MAG: acyltransferase family protein [Acidimicrobiia bacterium]